MRNLTMMTDLYQLTMMYGYYKCGMRDNLATFDMFYRSKDATTHYAIMAGVEQLIEYVENLHFDEAIRISIRGLNIFDEDFLDELRRFTFHGDIQAVPEGTIVFSHEPLIRVTAPIFEAQLIETALLTIINHQDAHRHEGEPRRAGRGGRHGDGVRPAPRAGAGRGHLRRARGDHRRLRRHEQRAHRPDVRHPRHGHARAQLGDVVSDGAGGVPQVRRAVPDELPAARGHLRHAAQRRAQRDHRVQGAARARLRAQGHPPRFRRSGLPEPRGAQDARRGRLPGGDHLRFGRSGRKPHSRTSSCKARASTRGAWARS